MSYRAIKILMYVYIAGYLFLGSVWQFASDSQDDFIVYIMIGYLFIPIGLLMIAIKIEEWFLNRKKKKANSL